MDMLQEKLIPDHIGKQWIAQNETPNRTGSIAKSITKKEGETENVTPEEDTLFLQDSTLTQEIQIQCNNDLNEKLMRKKTFTISL